MNWFSQVRAISTFFLACLVIFSTQSASACSKVMRWNDDPPFTFSEPRHPEIIKGISIDIARTIFKELNCDLKLKKMPWARALASLELGEIDLISNAYKTQERSEYAHFSSIHLQSPNILFLRVEEEAKWGLASLADIVKSSFKLGIQIDVSYSHAYDLLKNETEFAKHLYENSNRTSLWKMLSLKRVDGVIADKITGLIELKDLGLTGKIVPSSLIISEEPSFFAFSKKTSKPEFVEQFDLIFARLVDDGTISKIEAFYLNK